FGNADVAQYADDPVVDRFSRCAPEIMYWPWRSAMFKTLYRNDGTYRSLGVHRPRNPDPDRLDLARWFDGNGRDLPEEFRRRRIFSPFGRPNYRLAQLNHYPLGSKACFLLKRDRGRAVHSDHDLGMDYWVERNFNTDTDLSIKRYADRSHARREELLQDPELSRLHARAVAWRHMRFETLMEQEDYRALYGRLLGTPGSVPLGEAEARVLLHHAMKARAAQEGTD
ncbi:MAG: glycosyltransferase family 2 protein, partial [Pseudomonadota bacterium]